MTVDTYQRRRSHTTRTVVKTLNVKQSKQQSLLSNNSFPTVQCSYRQSSSKAVQSAQQVQVNQTPDALVANTDEFKRLSITKSCLNNSTHPNAATKRSELKTLRNRDNKSSQRLTNKSNDQKHRHNFSLNDTFKPTNQSKRNGHKTQRNTQFNVISTPGPINKLITHLNDRSPTHIDSGQHKSHHLRDQPF